MVFRQNVSKRFDSVYGHARVAAFKAIGDGFESARPQRAYVAMMNRQGRDGERSSLALGMAYLSIEQRIHKIERREVAIVCACIAGKGFDVGQHEFVKAERLVFLIADLPPSERGVRDS